MRRLWIVLALLLAPAAAHAAEPQYYVSLGDSLAAGFQVTRAGEVVLRDGYTGAVHRSARRSIKHLRLRNLACPGEDTTTFARGGCPYAAAASTPSQLARARRFMRAHRGQIALVTVSMGTNDVARCVDPRVIRACVADGERRLARRLPGELRKLRAAAGPAAQVAALEVYNLYLGGFFTKGRGYVRRTNRVTLAVNRIIRDAARVAGVTVVDGYAAFRSGALGRKTSYRGQPVPLAVAYACRYTQGCAPAPQTNVHPSARGYAKLAEAFLAAFAL